MDLIAMQGTFLFRTAFENMYEHLWWKLGLHENAAEIRSGYKIKEAEQQLQNIGDYISHASFIVAGGIKDDTVSEWMKEAQVAAFCLEDQIAMYRKFKRADNLVTMKKAIGKSTLRELISMIEGCINMMPEKVKDYESNQPYRTMPQLCEMYPLIRRSQTKPTADRLLFGMANTFNTVKELLIKSNHQVIFVIGGQGSGKSTLMDWLYKDSDVERSFSRCTCVDVEKTTDLAGLLRLVLQGYVEDVHDINELEIMTKIQDTFQGKRYFIVLDHVQDTWALQTLKHVLRGCTGKIICLTRIEGIQEDMNGDCVHIPSLEEEDARKLLMHVAFPDFETSKEKGKEVVARSDSTTNGDVQFKKAIQQRVEQEKSWDKFDEADRDKKIGILDQVLEEVLKKCMGNPWNIQAVGKLLAAYPFEKWEEIQKQIDELLIEGNRGTEKLDPPIELEDLKLSHGEWSSFLYCLVFPEGWDISARKLLRLWMAEGFVPDSPIHSQEHEAAVLRQVLIDKKLLVVKKKGFDGEVLKCSVSKHIRPLALEMCKLQKFSRFVPQDEHAEPLPSSLTFPNTPPPWKTLSSHYRVLAVHGEEYAKEASRALRKDVRLRSLLYFGTGRMPPSKLELPAAKFALSKLRYMLLRTLELQGAPLDNLPHDISRLACLRYLGLRNTQLEDLPPSLNELTMLLCLDIRDTNITSLDDVSAFTVLRHLHLANSFRSQSVVISRGLRSLTNLQTLSGAAIRGNLGQELLYLKNLGKLSIKASRASFKTICDAVSNMNFLRSLAIAISDEKSPEEKEKISDEKPSEGKEGKTSYEDQKAIDEKPPEEKQKTYDEKTLSKNGKTSDRVLLGKNIRKLKLGGDMGRFCANHISMMHSVTYLYLWDSKLEDDLLLMLQDLQQLLLLSLCNASTSDQLSCTRGGYRKLKKVSIIAMQNLAWCQFDKGSMKSLEEVVFAKCEKLSSSPPGLEHIGDSLKHVYFAEMNSDFRQSAKSSSIGEKVQEIEMAFHDAGSQTTAASATKGSKNRDCVVSRRNRFAAEDTYQDTKTGDGAFPTEDKKTPSEKGKPLVSPDRLITLTQNMRKLHDWYMELPNHEKLKKIITVKHRQEHLHREGGGTFSVEFCHLHDLYNKDALDVSLLQCWILYETQNQGKTASPIGFLDPGAINEKVLQFSPTSREDAENYAFNAFIELKRKELILLPYNFNFHWILYVIQPTLSKMFVLDPLNKAEKDFEECSALLRRAFERYCHTEGAIYTNKTLTLRTRFKCYKQPQGTNLCGYFVCRYMREILGSNIPDNDLERLNIPERGLDESEIQEIQNQLTQFIMRDVIKKDGEFHYDPALDTNLTALPDPHPEGSSTDDKGPLEIDDTSSASYSQPKTQDQSSDQDDTAAEDASAASLSETLTGNVQQHSQNDTSLNSSQHEVDRVHIPDSTPSSDHVHIPDSTPSCSRAKDDKDSH